MYKAILINISILYANTLNNNSTFCVLYFLALILGPYFLFNEEKEGWSPGLKGVAAQCKANQLFYHEQLKDYKGQLK